MIKVKNNKTMSFNLDIIEYLQQQENASIYVQDLIYEDMQKMKRLKKSDDLDITTIHFNINQDAAAKQSINDERKERLLAWESLSFELREEIKNIDNWGTVWKEVFFPLYVKNKGVLNFKDVRNWCFTNEKVSDDAISKERAV